MHARLPLFCVFFASGAAGLVSQVVWVRHVALAFGSTVHSASLVTAVFLGGLGLGGWLGGRLADRYPDKALRTYAIAELCLAGLGVALAFALPWLAEHARFGSTVADARGWQVISTGTRLARGLWVAGCIGPSALLMGATLTLLVRAVVDVRRVGLWIGALYGANTLGAAVGALATDLWLVPALGLFATLCAAASVNAVAGLLALALHAEPPAPRPAEATAPVWGVAIALFLAGFAAMGAELVWLRFLSAALGPYRAVFSTLIAVMLAGLCVGAVGAGLLAARVGHPGRLFGASQAAFAALLLWGLSTWDPEALVRAQRAVADSAELRTALFAVNVRQVLPVVLLPAVAMGASFPLGNALAQARAETLGRRAGALYLATTAGNVLGALLAGFVLLPGLGMQGTAVLCAAVACLAPLCVGRAGGIGLIGLIAVFVALLQPPDALLWASLPANRVAREGVLAADEGVEHIVVVTGRPEGPARLWTSGHPMTSTTAHAQRYMRLMAHLPLLAQAAPERVAVICFGVGNTLSAAALHPSVRELHAIDLSPDVLAHAHHFAHANRGVLDDPRLTVFIDDGRHHLRTAEARYDLITLEPPPIAHAGVASLYTVGFYEAARARLAPGGAISQWLPAYQVPEAEVRALVAAFASVFPEGVILAGSGRELLLLAGPEVRLAELQARIEARPAVAADLAAIGAPDARALAARFLGPVPTDWGPPLTDDHPTVEYSQVSHVMETRLPADLFAPTAIAGWCADCAADPALARTLALAEEVVRTEPFLAFSNLRSPTPTASVPWSGEGEAVDLLWQQPHLGQWLHAPASLVERALWLRQEGREAEAWRALELAEQQAPEDPHIADVIEAWER